MEIGFFFRPRPAGQGNENVEGFSAQRAGRAIRALHRARCDGLTVHEKYSMEAERAGASAAIAD